MNYPATCSSYKGLQTYERPDHVSRDNASVGEHNLKWWLSIQPETQTIFYTPEIKNFTSSGSAITSEIEQTLNYLRNLNIKIINSSKIHAYLRQFPDLIKTLVSLSKSAKTKILDSQLSLDVYTDPESGDKSLVLYVRQDSYSMDIMDIIDEVGSEYLEELRKLTGYLVLTSDFQPPIP